MLRKKADKKWKIGLIAIGSILLFHISGCSNTLQTKTQTAGSEAPAQLPLPKEQEKTEEIIEICFDLYEKAAEENKATDDAQYRRTLWRKRVSGC